MPLSSSQIVKRRKKKPKTYRGIDDKWYWA